jgi:lipopolysaccharide export system protein LptA
LTEFQFTEAVEYREEGQKGSVPRVARSRTLRLSLEQDAVKSAVFNGGTTFEEGRLAASGAEAQYQPDEGTLRLAGRDAGGAPRVADEHLTIDAPFIDVALETRQMTARGGVKTKLEPRPPAKEDAGAGEANSSGTRLPGLLQQDQAANVTSDRLQYAGASGAAIFAGNAQLWQGETAVRADTITIDQDTGNLLAAGSARSTIVMDQETSQGRATDIRYDDARRVIVYDAPPAPPAAAAPAATAPPAGGRAAAPAAGRGAAPVPAPPREAAMSRAKQDLRAQRIEVFLAPDSGRIDRVEAYTNVNAKVEKRVASGNRLTFHAEGERYDMAGTPGLPVKVVDGCRQITGKTLTFFTSTDRIIVDGNEETQTRTASAPCAQTPPR